MGAFLRCFRHIVFLPLVRYLLNNFKISGIHRSLQLNVSTQFWYLTAAKYVMSVVFTHVRCLSQSVSDSGWVDKVRMVIPVAAGAASKYLKS